MAKREVRTIRRYYSIPRVLYYLHMLRRNIWLKKSELMEIQQKKLRAIVAHAYENVEFYHRKFDSLGIKPNDIKTVEDLSRLPIIPRSEIQKNLNQIVAKGIRRDKCTTRMTSGSTGVPLTIVSDYKAFDFGMANNLRRFFECGGKFRDKWAFFIDVYVSSHRFPHKFLFEHLGILRQRYFSITDNIEDLMPTLKDYQPDVLFGYPSFIEVLAKVIEEKKIKIHPRLVFSNGELLDVHRRKLINRALGVEMFDVYACEECSGDIAWECSEHEGYHVNVDCNVVEFVRDGEAVTSGEEGEIVLTNLFNYAMPLIRYNIKDVGVLSDEECSCGRGLPLMKMIGGRADDYIILPSGRIVSPLSVTYTRAFPHVEGIARFRIIQERKDEFRILLVLLEGYGQEAIDQFENGFKKALGEDVRVNVIVVDAIPRDRSGKARRIISKVRI